MAEVSTGIIGREDELARLRKLLDSSTNGNGQTVFIGGEAGLGKTNLAHIIMKEARSQDVTTTIGHATSTESSEPYNPFREALAVLGDTEALSLEDQNSFDELFLISRVGLLITHLSSSDDEGVDEDILSSMLTAVQDFVKDSFGDGEMPTIDGGLGRLEYRNKKVLLEHGDFVFLAGVVSGEEHPRMRGDLNKLLANVEAEFGDLLRDWDGDLDSVSGTRDVLGKLINNRYPVRRTLESMNIEAERLAAQVKVQKVLEGKAEKGLILLLEDIHLADEATLMAIPYLSRNLRDKRVMICCTYEPDNMSDLLVDTINSMKKESIIEEIQLDRLSFENIGSIISSTLGGSNIPDGLAEMIHDEIGGNPFFIIEVLRTMLAQKMIFNEDGLWIFKSDHAELIPSSAADIVSKQLEFMSLDTIHVIEFASVLGTVFDPHVISMGAEMDIQRVRGILDELCDKELLSRMEDGQYTFRHGMVQEAIYSDLSQRWHNVLHRIAGESIEFLYEYDIDSVLFKLARHFSQTGEYDKGIDYSIEAGDKASNNYAPKEAAIFYEDASRLIGISGVRKERGQGINTTLASLYELNGMYDEAISASQKAREACTECSLIAGIDKSLGSIYFSKGEYDLSIQSFESAIQQAKEAKDELLLAGAYGGLGKVYLRKGEYDKALKIQQNYLDTSQRMGDDKEVAQAYLNLGGVYWHMSDYPKTIEAWESARKYMLESGYEQGITNAYNNLGVIYDNVGRFDDALDSYGKCLKLRQKIGDVRGVAMAYINVGTTYRKTGQLEQAIEMNKKSLEIRHRIGDMSGMANTYNNLGACFFDLEDYETAISYYEKYLGVVERIDDTWGIAQALNNLSEAEYELGKLEDAQRHCMKAIQIAEEHNFKDISAPTHTIMGSLLFKMDEWTGAVEHFEKGIVLSKEIGEPGKLGMAYLAFGDAYSQRGEKDKARDHLQNALAVFEKAEMKILAERTKKALESIRQ